MAFRKGHKDYVFMMNEHQLNTNPLYSHIYQVTFLAVYFKRKFKVTLLKGKIQFKDPSMIEGIVLIIIEHTRVDWSCISV